MKIPFVTFKPLEAELDKDLRGAFERVYNRSWYIEGVEDEAFENAMSNWDESENPLQNTYLIKVKDIEKIGETATAIKNLDSIDVVKYGEGMVDQLVTVFKVGSFFFTLSISSNIFILFILLFLIIIFSSFIVFFFRFNYILFFFFLCF